jgi:hypothetical protein
VALLLIVPTSSNALLLRVFLRQETVTNLMDPCVGSFVADTPVECGVWPRTAANVGPRTELHFDLPLNRPPFLGV